MYGYINIIYYISSMENEIWKDIPGYEGLYQASNLGRIKNLHRKAKHPKGGYRTVRERILKLYYNKAGYQVVKLSVNNKKPLQRVHRLVAFTFIDKPKGKDYINHKNEIKDDNRVENLEWCTIKYNSSYGTVKDRLRKKNINMKVISKPILAIKNNITVYFSSMMEAHRSGFHRVNIYRAIKNNNEYKNYKWEYDTRSSN
tara:strand:- start:1607 stop:2206 length:600 start_codon:yes stop_codon:yes gene_type:complete